MTMETGTYHVSDHNRKRYLQISVQPVWSAVVSILEVGKASEEETKGKNRKSADSEPYMHYGTALRDWGTETIRRFRRRYVGRAAVYQGDYRSSGGAQVAVYPCAKDISVEVCSGRI